MTGMTHRPRPYSYSRLPTAWVDFKTGRGVLDNGAAFTARTSGRRKYPTLGDVLDSVSAGLGSAVPKIKIMFTGKVPPTEPGHRHWLLEAKTPGWETPPGRGHWLGTPPTGRFVNELTDQYVEIHLASEWFGNTGLSPAEARDAWMLLDAMLTDAFQPALSGNDRSVMMHTPGSTGTNLWAASLPAGMEPFPVDDDIAEEIHATSGQHHLEHLVAGPSMVTHEDVIPTMDPRGQSQIDSFAYVDGRFMYAAQCRELGTGPGRRLTKFETYELLDTNPYARARICLRFTVPEIWDRIGIFGVQHPNPNDGWYYPNRPGATGVTWADASEVFVAKQYGWKIEPLEAVVFNEKAQAARKRFEPGAGHASRKTVKARPLDLWSQKLMMTREFITEDPRTSDKLRRAVGGALRAILIQSIGSFASRGRGSTGVTNDPRNLPPEYASSVVRYGDTYTYKIPQKFNNRQRDFYHPEYAAQVWGRARARVLHARVNGQTTGALTIPGEHIIGIHGDAIYTSQLPVWALPVGDGGADDGKAGRLRLQGYLPGPHPVPVTRAERDALRDKALDHGTATPDQIVDQAAFIFEWDSPDDTPTSYQGQDGDQQ